MKQLQLALIPGAVQRELYRTKSLRQIQAYLYHAVTLYFVISAYGSYQDYEVAKGEYFEHKNIYESLYDSDDSELFNYYHKKTKHYNDQMMNSYNQFKGQARGLGIIYVFNLADVIYSVIKF